MKKLIALGLCASLAACTSDNDNDSAAPDPLPTPIAIDASYELTVVNTTAGQLLSPLAAIVHGASESVFNVGDVASEGLEILAEGGDNSRLLAQTPGITSVSGTGMLAPGQSETLIFTVPAANLAEAHLSIASMLVNTNDGFTGVSGRDISGLAVGESLSFAGSSYDAGTELNTETAATIPGPIVGGEGFSPLRDDIVDVVRMHSGVVTADDGLRTSALSQAHRWDNPVARFRLTRVE